jgi:hypothetical protein
VRLNIGIRDGEACFFIVRSCVGGRPIPAFDINLLRTLVIIVLA